VESQGDDVAGWGKLLTHPPQLSGNPTSGDIWERVGGMDEEVRIFAYLHLRYVNGFVTCVKSYDMRPSALLSIRRKECCGLLSPLKVHLLSRV
jgi:hypothetical protein